MLILILSSCSAMFFHTSLVYLFNFFFEVTTKPAAPGLYISSSGTTSLKHQSLVGRSAQLDDFFSEFLTSGDTSILSDNQDVSSLTSGVWGNDLALFDSEVYSLDQNDPWLDEYIENPEEPADQDLANPDMFLQPGGEFTEGADWSTLCEGGDNLDWFVDNPSTLVGRDMIDDFFDLRIPDEILTPDQFCPNPLSTQEPPPESTKDTSRLPFRIPLPDLAGSRCRIEDGEGPLYALCCFMQGNGIEENACFPGRVFSLVSFISESSNSQFCLSFVILPIRFYQKVVDYAPYQTCHVCFKCFLEIFLLFSF